MALVSFGYRVDMYAIDPPLEVGAYIVAYDLDGVLKQKDHLGVVTLIGAGAGGPQGPAGPVGPAGLTWSGYWMATQSYSQNYAVGYGSASWWCISDVVGATSNSAPDVDTTHWTLLAAQGSPGSQGGTGSQGLQGAQGEIGINWIGDWIINVYDVRDAVYYNGSSYVCIASTVGTETLSPDTNTTCWEPLALKGDVGPAGATGSQGVTGSQGDSYWSATGSNIINNSGASNSIVIVNNPAGGLNDLAFKTATFTNYAGQSGFGVYNGGNVGGNYFYGSWFNTPAGGGLQDFSGYTRFYINPGDPYNWISNQPINIGTGTVSDARFLVSSSGGTNSLVVNEQGDTIFSGNTKISGQTFSNLPPGSITFGGKTAIYSPENNTIVIGTSILDTYNYNYGWKFNTYQIENLAGNAIEFRNSIGTIGNLWIGSNYTFAGLFVNTQQSTLFVKGTTSSIMKVVGTGATWSNSDSIFSIEDSGKVSIGPTFSSAFSNSRLDINVGSFGFGVHTNGDYVTSKSGGGYAFRDSATGMWEGGVGNIIFKAYSTATATFKFDPQYTTLPAGYSNVTQKIILQEYTIAASSSNNQIRMIELSPTINKTGTASGIDIGLYIKPTLTSDINKFRSIEVTDGVVMFNTLGGYVNIGSTQSIAGTKLFIQSSTSSTTLGSNVMLDLYNSSDDGVVNVLSELAFSAKGQPFANDPYNINHRYALVSGYVNQFNNLTSGGGLIFSTRETTSSSLTERVRITHDGRVGVGVDPVTTAILQVDSTTKGFLPPRMTNTQRTSITSPEVGLIVYCTDATEGLYVYKSTGWQFIA